MTVYQSVCIHVSIACKLNIVADDTIVRVLAGITKNLRRM